jgi:hypothetical protein
MKVDSYGMFLFPNACCRGRTETRYRQPDSTDETDRCGDHYHHDLLQPLQRSSSKDVTKRRKTTQSVWNVVMDEDANKEPRNGCEQH